MALQPHLGSHLASSALQQPSPDLLHYSFSPSSTALARAVHKMASTPEEEPSSGEEPSTPTVRTSYARAWDLRLCKSYQGAQDPNFRKDCLEDLGMALMSAEYFDSEWSHVLEALKLHPSSTPGEAAARALELLSPEGRGRVKELQAIAALLGRDRDSLKLTGASPLEAIDQAFTKLWEDLERAKTEGGQALGPPPPGPAATCSRLPPPAAACTGS